MQSYDLVLLQALQQCLMLFQFPSQPWYHPTRNHLQNPMVIYMIVEVTRSDKASEELRQ